MGSGAEEAELFPPHLYSPPLGAGRPTEQGHAGSRVVVAGQVQGYLSVASDDQSMCTSCHQAPTISAPAPSPLPPLPALHLVISCPPPLPPPSPLPCPRSSARSGSASWRSPPTRRCCWRGCAWSAAAAPPPPACPPPSHRTWQPSPPGCPRPPLPAARHASCPPAPPPEVQTESFAVCCVLRGAELLWFSGSGSWLFWWGEAERGAQDAGSSVAPRLHDMGGPGQHGDPSATAASGSD